MAQESTPKNVSQKLISSHLLSGKMQPGEEIALKIDQTLTQDATGTAVMLELEAMGLKRVKTELSAQYVDHNLIQQDNKNPDDHVFLRSAAKRWGIWFSRPGNGVSHPVHQEHFGKPGKTMAGSDSHTPAAGAIGMLAIGSGGLEVALAMAGEPLNIKMPEIWGVKLTGSLPDWVSAKDVILEMLRRHDVDGGRGRIIEYYGPGLDELSVMDRHVIANMGTELGATSTVFPSDAQVKKFLRRQGREDDWSELLADPEATYDVHEELDLSELEPLCALPSSPGNVVPVREVAGQRIYQAYVGSSANPGWRDFAVVAEILKGKQAFDGVSLDINPTTRQVLENLTQDGHLLSLIQAGARLHQAGCNGCIGMGQAPAKGEISLRTVPRNFPSRSGTKDDKVHLVSPETAAASALRGEICDPRELKMDYPRLKEPDKIVLADDIFIAPLAPDEAEKVALVKGPNIHSLPKFDPLPDRLSAPVALKMGDGISTDEILRAGAEVLPFRSNIPAISRFAFDVVDPEYYDRAVHFRDIDEHADGHSVVAGDNYGQGSSREHAAIAPRFLGLRFALAKSYARIHWQNLANFGVLPLEFIDEADYDALNQGDTLRLNDLHAQLQQGNIIEVENTTQDQKFKVQHTLSNRQIQAILNGGLIPLMKMKLGNA